MSTVAMARKHATLLAALLYVPMRTMAVVLVGVHAEWLVVQLLANRFTTWLGLSQVEAVLVVLRANKSVVMAGLLGALKDVVAGDIVHAHMPGVTPMDPIALDPLVTF